MIHNIWMFKYIKNMLWVRYRLQMLENKDITTRRY